METWEGGFIRRDRRGAPVFVLYKRRRPRARAGLGREVVIPELGRRHGVSPATLRADDGAP
jgi:hypothetical protein